MGCLEALTYPWYTEHNLIRIITLFRLLSGARRLNHLSTHYPTMRSSDFFIHQSPSDDEDFPYWTPVDYLRRKFDLENARIRQFLAARVSFEGYSRHPSVRTPVVKFWCCLTHYSCLV
jgi:hypothetical protein